MKILLKYTKITLSLILVLFLMVQCEEDVELPKVEAGFTQTINEDTGTVAFINTSTKATKYLWAWILRKGGTHVREGVLSSHEWEITFARATRKGYWRLSAVSQMDPQEDWHGERNLDQYEEMRTQVMPKDRELMLEEVAS